MRTNKKRMREIKRGISMLLITALMACQIPQSLYAKPAVINAGSTDMVTQSDNEEKQEKPPLSYYGLLAGEKGVQLYCNTADFNCNLYSGKDFTFSGSDIRIE